MCREEPDTMILTQIEAKEACDWLRATGFPQYAQLYEDLLFPIDITLVKREHDFLDRDAIEALCRPYVGPLVKNAAVAESDSASAGDPQAGGFSEDDIDRTSKTQSAGEHRLHPSQLHPSDPSRLLTAPHSLS